MLLEPHTALVAMETLSMLQIVLFVLGILILVGSFILFKKKPDLKEKHDNKLDKIGIVLLVVIVGAQILIEILKR
ncbi:hypothetical protein K8R43_00340 [archaeon]|nr:hypothetical protein [archaeon]